MCPSPDDWSVRVGWTRNFGGVRWFDDTFIVNEGVNGVVRRSQDEMRCIAEGEWT